jgi:serine-type D-Ala-D-Ala endopeptidase (penicillin-binding protein 7)
MRAVWILLMAVVGILFVATNNAVAAEPQGKTVSTRHHAKSSSKRKHVTLRRIRHHRHHRRHVAHVRRSHRAIDDDGDPIVRSAAVLVTDQSSGTVLFERNANAVMPIASISKLMTAMVVLDAKPDMSEILTISRADIDRLKGSHSRLRVGTELSRADMLHLALMASENRAASALSRYYPGGRPAFVAAMNEKARGLGLTETHFEDPTGLNPANVSSARDLARLVAVAHRYPDIRKFTTSSEYEVTIHGRERRFHNTNRLVGKANWDIGLSKTGYISEAGKCLVMQAWMNNRPTIIVLLDSQGRLTRIGDANRIRRWMEHAALASNDTPG